MMRATIVVGLTCIACAPWSRAHAHPIIDAARGRLDEADFAGARRTLEAAEEATDFTREDATDFYYTRALISYSLLQPDEMAADVARLLALDPSFAAPADAPRDLARELERARPSARPLALSVELVQRGGASMVRAVVVDGRDLVRDVRIALRTSGSPWQRGEGELAVPRGARAVDLHAEATGVGGAILATHGTAERPDRVEIYARAEAAPIDSIDDGVTEPWVWVAVIGGGAAAIATFLVLAFVEPGFLLADTTIERASIEW